MTCFLVLIFRSRCAFYLLLYPVGMSSTYLLCWVLSPREAHKSVQFHNVSLWIIRICLSGIWDVREKAPLTSTVQLHFTSSFCGVNSLKPYNLKTVFGHRRVLRNLHNWAEFTFYIFTLIVYLFCDSGPE